MTLPLFTTGSASATGLLLAAHLAGGLALGALYFRALWWNAQRFGDGAGMALPIALTVGRFVLLAAVLVGVSLEGAMPLLATALGLFIARFLVVRRFRHAAHTPADAP